MICRECRATLFADGSQYVEMCNKHADMVYLQSAVDGFGPSPFSIERRCYALLQAAATLRSQVDTMYAWPDNSKDTERCVKEAENLLAEIEKREKESQS